jgi:hypothetical protein
MSTIINRLRWLSAGVYLGIAFVIWIKGEEEKSKLTPAEKKLSDTYNQGQAMNDLYKLAQQKRKATNA